MDFKPNELEELINRITREVITMLFEMKISFDTSSNIQLKEIYRPQKELITEKGIEELYLTGFREIIPGKGCIITPLAKDKARELGVNITLE